MERDDLRVVVLHFVLQKKEVDEFLESVGDFHMAHELALDERSRVVRSLTDAEWEDSQVFLKDLKTYAEEDEP